jgi:hypothetical protein
MKCQTFAMIPHPAMQALPSLGLVASNISRGLKQGRRPFSPTKRFLVRAGQNVQNVILKSWKDFEMLNNA